jgi:uncharacterized protein YecT (DUF1311 family)
MADVRHMRHRLNILFCAFAVLGAGFPDAPVAFAQTPLRASETPCDSKALQPRALQECLRKAQDDSERLLRERIQTISGIIERAQGLPNPQKTRWKKALEDSQGQWVRFRNAECQDLTTFESKDKQRIAEEQRLCVIEYNERRMSVLLQRYPALTN